MGKTGISEFSFGFAFLFEQTNQKWENLTAMPILPSLREEYDKGWDARLPTEGTIFYYQFKLSDYLYRGNANFIKDDTYDAPYFRITLHKNDNNRQHNLLKQLARDNPETYYVAPEIQGIEAFNEAFLGREIYENSRLIPVRECRDIIDDEQHHITFQRNIEGWTEHSEIVRHETSFLGKNIEAVYRASKQSWHRIDQDFARNTLNKNRNSILESTKLTAILSDKSRSYLEEDFDRDTISDFLQRNAFIVSNVYGAFAMLVGSAKNDDRKQ